MPVAEVAKTVAEVAKTSALFRADVPEKGEKLA